VFRGKPVERVEPFGSAARGEMTPQSNVDILATPSPEGTRRYLFLMAAEVEDALGDRLILSATTAQVLSKWIHYFH
jgi:predicted nucleotidyltransferase